MPHPPRPELTFLLTLSIFFFLILSQLSILILYSESYLCHVLTLTLKSSFSPFLPHPSHQNTLRFIFKYVQNPTTSHHCCYLTEAIVISLLDPCSSFSHISLILLLPPSNYSRHSSQSNPIKTKSDGYTPLFNILQRILTQQSSHSSL